MRIRKNAKISAILHTSSNIASDGDEYVLQNNLCQLNQSPWDIITFPSADSSSSFYQFDDTEVCYNVNVAINGSPIDSIQDFESVASKTSELGANDNISVKDNDYDVYLGFKEEVETSEIQEEIKLCGKRDKKGWQCGSVVKNGNTMCDYHVFEIQNQAVWTTKKKSGPSSKLTAGARSSRPKKQSTSNPHEFYYYSGFGPSWGKKRGLTTGTTSSRNTGYRTNSMNGDMLVQEETGEQFEPDMSKVGSVELNYFDDDNDDDDDNEIGKVGIIGRKRRRKPIKERSLKSLM